MGRLGQVPAVTFLKNIYMGWIIPIQLSIKMYSRELLLNRVIFNPLMGLHSNPICLTEPTGVIRARAC